MGGGVSPQRNCVRANPLVTLRDLAGLLPRVFQLLKVKLARLSPPMLPSPRLPPLRCGTGTRCGWRGSSRDPCGRGTVGGLHSRGRPRAGGRWQSRTGPLIGC